MTVLPCLSSKLHEQPQRPKGIVEKGEGTWYAEKVPIGFVWDEEMTQGAQAVCDLVSRAFPQPQIEAACGDFVP
jgi:hypothetical protein